MSRLRFSERRRAKWQRDLPRRVRYDYLLTRMVARRQHRFICYQHHALEQSFAMLNRALSSAEALVRLMKGPER